MTKPDIIVHRAGGFHAPENTLSALKVGLSYSVDGVEIDVLFTSDHVPVVFHDNSLHRITGYRKKVHKTSYEKIQSLDAGSWFDPTYEGEPIPTLDQFLQQFDSSKQLYLEVKRDSDNLLVIPNLLKQYNLLSNTIVLSFSMDALIKIKEHDNTIKTMFLMGARWRKPLSYSIHPSIDSYGLSYRLAHRNNDLVKELQKRRYPVNIWSCNDMEIALELINLGVTSITTDLPDKLIETIKNNLPQ